ncbi:MAG: hypothetical protein FWH32_05245 [Clostridiales bacterium]|nr:hypothetical protein [Clostridiales bacterium]
MNRGWGMNAGRGGSMKWVCCVSGIIAAVLLALLLAGFATPAESEGSIDDFLNEGNAYYRLGDAAEDIEQKIGLFAMALKTYEEGIIEYPQNVPLKFNYEFVKKKLEELLDAMEQEGEGEQGEGDESEGEQGEGEQGDEGAEDESDGAEMMEGDESPESEDGEEDPDMDAIERILAMLESQEQENLKNNQEVKEGRDGGNAW